MPLQPRHETVERRGKGGITIPFKLCPRAHGALIGFADRHGAEGEVRREARTGAFGRLGAVHGRAIAPSARGDEGTQQFHALGAPSGLPTGAGIRFQAKIIASGPFACRNTGRLDLIRRFCPRGQHPGFPLA